MAITPDFGCPARAEVKGDGVAQNQPPQFLPKWCGIEMLELDALYPGYGIAGHKGYPTELICKRCKNWVTHRRSFKPVRDCLAQL